MRRPMNEQRFWETMKLRYPNECWEWQNCPDKDGYGNVVWFTKMQKAHRLAYCLERGIHIDIIKGRFICHTCDNPPCCNPEHLWLGTNADNMRDMVNKGRSADMHGEKAPNSTLTEYGVTQIRHKVQDRTQQSLADEYGVCRTTIQAIVNRRSWTHI